jgi:GT2 family glycosyltransferase
MRICAIILNHFGFTDTVGCVESLLKSNGLGHIVVVENSVSEEELNGLETRLLGRGPVAILCSEKNLGFAGGVKFALNAIGISNFDAFLILNNDTLVPQDTVTCLETRLNNGGFDFVAPSIYSYPETSVMWSDGNYYNRFTGLISHCPLLVMSNSIFYLSGCCLLIRSGVFQSIGYFDEAFFMYGEDVEFCYRATRKGLKFGLVPEARIFHKGSGSSGNNSLFYEYHTCRSHLLLCSKLARSPKEERCSWFLKLIVMSMRSIWRVFRFGNFNSLRGLRRAVSEPFGAPE